ncbi:inositol 1,4,5-trisphosphate receptor-interacting protein-like 1 [Excalfactoria chinensis]|uniref:inositol 1,4,5-trisphosphate receptor-interacting protein-like 1 n=1 Tax=Excalfactoria chinensis TaxID=46218 RepID=UPI003B3A494A
MALAFFFALLAQRVSFVGDELDAETLERMRQREVFLQEQMTQQWLYIENLEKSRMGIRALLFSPLSYWKIWNVILFLVLLFCFTRKIYKKFQDIRSSTDEESSVSKMEQQEPEQQQEEEEDLLFADLIWPVRTHQTNCREVHLLFSSLIDICQNILVDTFYPVPECPIGVGSVYEGWYPAENIPVFCLLVPLMAPHGHVFRLDLGTTGQLPARNSRIRVHLECTCGREQQMGMRCFLHSSKKQLRNQHPSLLKELCTDSYLDVEKTARWFQALIKDAWDRMRFPEECELNVEESGRSCRLSVTDFYKQVFLVNILFGVQQDNTDIFLSSQEIEAGKIPSTTWPQSCAVAEVKFFQHVATRAEESNFYVRYMQVCAYILAGLNFSTCELKTMLMQLLTAIPLESWQGKYFLQRMDDILHYLRCCVEVNRLNHFFIGNEDVPAEIILPQEFQVSKPLNLFEYLVNSPVRQKQALEEVDELQDRLASLLIYGK